MKKYLLISCVISMLLIIVILLFIAGVKNSDVTSQTFDGQRAFADLEYQVSLGPRVPGSTAHEKTVTYIQSELESSGWEVEVQTTTFQSYELKNVVARIGEGSPWVILGAHYDSRIFADKDENPQNRALPVPGANDGASGVSVLLELGRCIPGLITTQNSGRLRSNQVWIVFFDAEDNGGIGDWEWILGSRAFVTQLNTKPDAVVILDMIGDHDLNIYQEMNSNPLLVGQIWSTASKLGYEEYFIPQYKHSILDDHTPFLEAGIPAVDIIDIDYPYWHTRNDTPDKVSVESLQVIGDVILAWLQGRY